MRVKSATLPPLRAKGLERLRARAGEAAALLKALSNESRLLILCTLAGKEMSVSELNEQVPLSQSALSQQLAVLRHKRLVATRREGQTIYYSLAPTDALRVISVLREIYCPREPLRAKPKRRSGARV
jgi:ArsR family transcriptional regulator